LNESGEWTISPQEAEITLPKKGRKGCTSGKKQTEGEPDVDIEWGQFLKRKRGQKASHCGADRQKISRNSRSVQVGWEGKRRNRLVCRRTAALATKTGSKKKKGSEVRK